MKKATATQQPPTIIKKVKAFPIEAVVTFGTSAVPVRILKLTSVGIMCDTGAHFVNVGAHGDISFTLPAVKLPVQAHLLVVRTWDQFATDMVTGKPAQKIAEFHFRGISPEHKENVGKFLESLKKPHHDD